MKLEKLNYKVAEFSAVFTIVSIFLSLIVKLKIFKITSIIFGILLIISSIIEFIFYPETIEKRIKEKEEKKNKELENKKL